MATGGHWLWIAAVGAWAYVGLAVVRAVEAGNVGAVAYIVVIGAAAFGFMAWRRR